MINVCMGEDKVREDLMCYPPNAVIDINKNSLVQVDILVYSIYK
jgi:hypothetical protein